MKLLIKFIDNEIIFSSDKVISIEIENKNYFYRIVSAFNKLGTTEKSDEINIYDEKYEEVNLLNKTGVYIDYFNIDFNNKKNITLLYNIANKNLNETTKSNVFKLYNKVLLLLKKELNSLDLSIKFDDECNIENILKIIKISIEQKDNLMDNLLLLVDIEKTLNLNRLLIFVNLKQYLSKIELFEFYKYVIYNKIDTIFVDSKSYGVPLDNENKLIIDEDLDEFML